MLDIDTITAEARRAAREQAAGHMLDAIECITDDHVRRHAAEGWWDLLAGHLGDWPQIEDVRGKAESAIKSLTAAIADLDDLDRTARRAVTEQALDVLARHGVVEVDVVWSPPVGPDAAGRGRPGEWRWTCDRCGVARVFVGPIEDPTDHLDLVGLAAAHVGSCDGGDL